MKKNRVLTKVIAAALVIMTVMSAFSASFTASAMDMENASKKAGKAIITTGAGKIPVIGDFAKSALDPILSELFGIKSGNEEILKKLDEITTRLDGLKSNLDRNTQEILKDLSEAKRNEFNTSITSLRTMVLNNYTFLREIENPDNSDYTKAVLTAEMLDFSMKNADNIEVLTETLTEYVKGTEINILNVENIYDYVYCVSCDGSVLGGEAAIKAAEYINNVNEIITSSYKLMALVLSEKLYVFDHYSDILSAAGTDENLKNALATITSEDFAKYKVGSYRGYWSALLNKNYGKEYNAVYSLDNPDSTVSKYNQMVLDNWFTYIRDVRYSSGKVTINRVYLNREMEITSPSECGLDKNVNMFGAIYMINTTTQNLNQKIYSVLTEEEVQKLYSCILCSSCFNTDENGNKLSLYDALKEYGFTFNKLENAKKKALNTYLGKLLAENIGEENLFRPFFVCNAEGKFDTRFYANYAGYDGFSSETERQTVTYFNMYHKGTALVEDSANDYNAVMYFTAA